MKRRRRPRDRARATMHSALELTPGQQQDLEDQRDRKRRGDPFPPKPEWTDQTLATLSDTFDGGDYPAARRPFTPAEEAAAEYVGRFTQQVWRLARAGRFGEARRLAVQWGTPRGPQRQPAPGSHPYQRESGPRPGFPGPYTPDGPSADALFSMLPQMPRHSPLPPMALEPVRTRRAAVAEEWLGRLHWPLPYDGYGHEDQLAAYMRSVAVITGTHTPLEHAGAWPERTTDAGGPVPASRGLAITAGMPRRRHAAAGPPDRKPRRSSVVDLAVLDRIRARLESLPERRSA